MTKSTFLATIVAAWACAACGVEATPSPMDLGRYEAALVRQMNATYTGTVAMAGSRASCPYAGGTYSLDLVSRSPFRCVYEDVDASCERAQQAAIDVVDGHLALADAPAIDTQGSLHLTAGVGADGRNVAVATIKLRVDVDYAIYSRPEGGYRPDDSPDGFEIYAGWTCALAITEFVANE